MCGGSWWSCCWPWLPWWGSCSFRPCRRSALCPPAPLPRPTASCPSGTRPSVRTPCPTPTRRSWAWPPPPTGPGIGWSARRRHLRLRRRPVLRVDRHDPLNAPIVGMAVHPGREGLLARGRRRGHVRLRRRPVLGIDRLVSLNQPIVGMAAGPDGGATGWWPPTVASSPTATPNSTARPATSAQPAGGGDDGQPRRKGLLDGGRRRRDLRLRRRVVRRVDRHDVLNQPMVGMAAGPGGKGTGWWPPMAALHLRRPIVLGLRGCHQPAGPAVGIAAAPSGGGYWLVFGSARSPEGRRDRPRS